MNKRNYRSEGEARVLLNSLSDAAIIIDQNGLFLMANDEFGKLTGLNPEGLIGEPFLNLPGLAVENKAVLLKNLSKRLQGVPIAPYELSFTALTGETRLVEVKGKKICYAGQPADLVIVHDITHGK
jgi:PAS domain S-box-containing protein